MSFGLVIILLFTGFYFSSVSTKSTFFSNDPLNLNASPDIYEDDNDFSTAKDILINTVQNRSISTNDDVDYVKFNLDTYATIDIETNGTFGDTRMWLYTFIETLLYFDDDGGDHLFSLISADPLPPGLYYIKIDEFGNDEVIANYTLSLTVTYRNDYHEPDSCANSVPLINKLGIRRSIYPIGDVDYFEFTIIEESNITLTTSGPNGDTEMSVYAECDNPGSLIAYDDDGNPPGFSQIVLNNSLPGTYYVHVNDYQDNSEILDYALYFLVDNNSTRNDNSGPSISSIETLPANPYSPEDITIIAHISDISGISQAYLHYSIDSGPLIQAMMLPAYYGMYFASIGSVDVGCSVEYFITATDGSSSFNGAINDNGGLNYSFIVNPTDGLDIYEKDNSFPKSSTIAFNSTQDRRIYPIGDKDFASFELKEKQLVVIETALSNGDSYISLRSANGSEIILDDSDGASQIEITLDSGNYTVVVFAGNNDHIIPSYTLSLMVYEVPIISEFTYKWFITVYSILPILAIIIKRKKKKRK